MAAEVLSYEDCDPEIDVFVVHPDGFIYGTESCGSGAHMVWAAVGEVWVVLIGMQDLVDCSEFERAGIPPGTGALECLRDWEETLY